MSISREFCRSIQPRGSLLYPPCFRVGSGAKIAAVSRRLLVKVRQPDNETIMNTNILPSPFDPATKSEHVSDQASTFDDLLPASYRTPEEDVAPPTLNAFFLRKELEVDRLNSIHDWLWLVGRPRPPRPLYYQRAVGRNIVLHGQADVHCVWDERRIFLKPVPRWLLERQVWRDFLSCHEGCLSAKPTQYSKMHGSSFNQPKATKEGECERCELSLIHI